MATYEFAHTETSTAPAAVIWPFWADTSRWPEWDTAVRSVDLDGPFAAGTSGTMTMDGMPPIPFTLTEVTEGRSFTDETRLPDAYLRFEHVLTEDGGETRITYRVTIDGSGGFGPQVTDDTPDAMRALARLAEKAAAEG
ncbi:SRPBCC family protein [Amycolatopsis australiensis]|uniref:Polyketide cyclase / dehydrase and lipid transport n=1 Tax=Amycolatopsis australiensis TaxID=546364 RepID=A0A1K1R3Y3_9PSEU|nr:SRPBCC family protein [Amycolatopsis australiensis]SFW66302.1 Polyketide cyclase / dehydrase and lipid transport [Amycolatopsis australiensis]